MIDEETRRRVSDRLAMVKHLIEMNDPLAVPANAGPSKGKDGRHDGGWIHTHAQLDSLVEYLLLTCFDALGQRTDWVSFDGWLKREESEGERSEALAGGSQEDTIDGARRLHDWYNQHYGVKTGFVHFIDAVLTPNNKRLLLDSIRLLQFKSGGVEVVEADKNRKDLLFRFRNEFTHKAVVRGTARQPDGSRLTMATVKDVLDGKLKGSFPSMHLFTEHGRLCLVHDWPFTLYRVVAEAIGEEMPAFDVNYTVFLKLTTGQQVYCEGVARADLEDPVKKAAYFKRVDAEALAFLAANAERE